MSLPDIATNSSASILRASLDAGAYIDERDVKGRTALFRSARVGRLEHVVLVPPSLNLEFWGDYGFIEEKKHHSRSPLRELRE